MPHGLGIADPTQLQFYPPNWAETLTTAKGFWQLFLTMTFGFPKHCHHKDELWYCLTRAIAALQEEGSVLEPGEYVYLIVNTLTLITD